MGAQVTHHHVLGFILPDPVWQGYGDFLHGQQLLCSCQCIQPHAAPRIWPADSGSWRAPAGNRLRLGSCSFSNKVLPHAPHNIWKCGPTRSKSRTKSLVWLVDSRTEKDTRFYQNVYTPFGNLPLEICNLSLA